MYLKTLTIRGFKSFASKTTFEFEPGVTSVIGPNGSGKSNVVDALAWVMGEQGVKNLRGGKMEDVIFAGTTGRSPLGRAQVELTIDNADGTLPIDYSEVTISRTLFRSGGSEYQINGEPARLLDIQELLSDTGLGREMHVIVGQGQLDRILQATPHERRGFIEEAAGILKHRRRKERSERKLESMRANLDRIRDLTDEVKRQLGPLSKQADTARRAQRIQHDVRDATARLLAEDVVTQAARVQELVASDKDLQTQQQTLTTQLDRAETTVKQLSEKYGHTTQAASSARDHRYQLTSLAERFRSLHAITQERLKTASRPAMSSSGLSPEEAGQQLVDIERTHEESQQRLEDLRQALSEAQARREAFERQARVAQETYTQLIRQEADQQRDFAQATSRKDSAKTKLEVLTAELHRLEQDGAHRSDASQEFAVELADHQAALATAQATLEAQQAEQDTVQEQVATARRELRDVEDRLNQLKNDISAAKARTDVLGDSLRPEPGSALAALEDLAPSDLSELLNIEPGWENAIAALLAGSTDHLWLESVEDGLLAVETLTQHTVSDVRIFFPSRMRREATDLAAYDVIPASSVVSARGSQSAAYEHLVAAFGSAILVESFAQAQQIMQHTVLIQNIPDLRIATKQGHIVTADWIEARGDGTASSLERRAAYDKALADHHSLLDEFNTVERQHRAATATYQRTKTLQQHAATAVHEAQSAVTTLRERVTIQQRNVEQQKQAQQRFERHRTALRTDLTKAQETFNHAQERFEALAAASTMVEDASIGVEQAAQTQQTAEQEASSARAAETEARLSLRTAENTAQQAGQRVEQARRRLAAAKIAQREYQRALARQRQTILRLTGVIEGIDLTLEKIGNSVQRAQQDFQELESQRTALQTDFDAAEAIAQRARLDLSVLQEQLHKRGLIRQEHELKLEQLHDKALNDLGYSHKYLVEHFGPDQPVDTGDTETSDPVSYDRGEQQARLRAATRQLSALGKINPLALEEYAAVQERHEYLTQQLADLEGSRRNLLKIIEDVNATVLEIFSAAYADTAAQFQHVFATLFPGGEGRLSLTEPDNMLGTGIEVEARPAGKKIRRLSLLSGGERSLAAIALLVSIFKARPSPFYVMDEVEAALDDTNLTRLLTLLKELQHDSQLIIITHQKRTMEISDALYGISMRGDGVSQVISQKLDQASSDVV